MPNIRELREMADWTQARASKASGINRAKLSLAECGEIELSVEEDAAVRNVLLQAIRIRSERINAFLSETLTESSDPNGGIG
jgi:transcriptional regulator with XRE-family HTH domain